VTGTDIRGLFGRNRRLPVKDTAVFCRQLAVLLEAGVPLLSALESLSLQTSNRSLRRSLAGVIGQLERGTSFAESLRSSGLFPEIAVTMVEVGELGGVLETVLGHLAAYFEREYTTREKLRSALTYPAVVVLIALVTFTILISFVLPSLTSVIQELGGTVPPLTAWALKSGYFIQAHWVVLALSFLFMVLVLARLANTGKARELLDPLLIRLPVLGGIIQQAAVGRFCRTLSTLVTTGVPILAGLEVAGRCSGNSVIRSAVNKAVFRVRDGESLAVVLTDSAVFPRVVVQMVSVGERSGALAYCLGKAADLYEYDTQCTVERMVTLLEPVMIVGLGGLIGLIIMSVLMPMFEVLGSIG